MKTEKICERILMELSKLVGFEEKDTLAPGGRIKIADKLITFIHDTDIDEHNLCIYVDFGKPVDNDDETVRKLLKINFELDIAQRGTLSLHPVTEHAIFSFRYQLNEQGSGQALIDEIARAVADVAIEGANVGSGANDTVTLSKR